MIDYAAFMHAVREWARASSSLELVQYINEPREQHQRAQILLQVTGEQPTGAGSQSLREIPEGSNEFRLVTKRAFYVTVRVICDSYSQCGDEFAFVYLNRMRMTMRRPEQIEILRCAGIAIGDVTPTTVADYVVDDLNISRAFFDVRFGVGAEYVDEDAPSADVIEQVEAEALPHDVSGALVGDVPNPNPFEVPESIEP